MARGNLFVIGIIVGTLIGAAAGLLVASKTGKETRDLLRGRVNSYAGALRDRFRRGRTTDGAGEYADSPVEVCEITVV